MPRAPKGYRTGPDGIVRKVAVPVGPTWCNLGGRLVANTHRLRKNHTCPSCGAQVGWSTVLHPDLWFWDKHIVGSGADDMLTGFDTLDGPAAPTPATVNADWTTDEGIDPNAPF